MPEGATETNADDRKMLRVCVGFRFQLFINKIKKLKSTDNVAFVIQKRFRQIEIIRPRFLLMNHDLVLLMQFNVDVFEDCALIICFCNMFCF